MKLVCLTFDKRKVDKKNIHINVKYLAITREWQVLYYN